MKFKEAVIKTTDIAIGLSFIVLALVVASLAMSGAIWKAIIVVLIGWTILCLCSSLWYVASSMHDNLIAIRKALENK